MALTQVSTGGIKDGQVHTADLADAQITAGKLHADALDHTYTLGASGTDHYTFTGEGLTGAVNDPTLYLTRGKTYRFVNGNSSGAHPFRIQSVAGAGGTEYNTGVTNNAGAGGSTIIFEVPHDAPDVLYYICTSHAAMNGIFYVTGALADGTVTTAKLADDAVTDAKIANSINTAIAANTAKTTNATHTGEVTGATALTIADDVVDEANLKVSNSPTNGYFLSAQSGNTGGLTWAEAQGTTINNNADNRVITGSGTANTLEGESGVTYDGTNFLIGTGVLKLQDESNGAQLRVGTGNDFQIEHDGSNTYLGNTTGDTVIQNDANVKITAKTGGTQRFRFDSDGLKFGTDTAAANALDDYEEGTFSLQPVNGWGILNGGALNPANAAISEGKYVRIGATVYIYCCYSEGGSSGASFNGNRLLFTGLPFNADTDGTNTSNVQHIIFGANYNINSSDGMGMFMTPSTSGHSVASIYRQQTGGRSDFTGSSMGSTGKLWFSGTYRINGT